MENKEVGTLNMGYREDAEVDRAIKAIFASASLELTTVFTGLHTVWSQECLQLTPVNLYSLD